MNDQDIDTSLARIATVIRGRRLEVPALLALELCRPLSGILSAVTTMSAPFVEPMVGAAALRNFQSVLDCPERAGDTGKTSRGPRVTGAEHASPAILALLLLMLIPVLVYVRRAKRGDRMFVRRIAGIDAIEEAIGRSAELGRPIAFNTGMTDVGPVLYACLGVLSYIAARAARFKSKLLLPQRSPEAMAIVEDVVRDAYRSVGREGSFDPQSIIFLSEEQFAFASGYMGLVHRERVASAFLFGSFAAESLILAEAGQQAGALQVASSVSPEQVAFFLCTCDYTLIGEELFASSAYLSKDPVQLGSLAGQDRAKAIFFIMILIGVAISTWNSIAPDSVLPNIDSLFSYDFESIISYFRRS